MIQTIIFYVLSAVVVIPALMVVTTKNVFHSALWLVASLIGVGGMYAMLAADFIFAVQLMVYAGGIMVILLFVILLSGRPSDWEGAQVNEKAWAAGLFSVFLITLVGSALYSWPLKVQEVDPKLTIAALGKLILGEMVIPFEVVSLVLLASLVGAIYFSPKEVQTMIGPKHFLIVAAILFALGIYGILSRRNLVGILMSIELLFNAVGLNFIAFNRYLHPEGLWGQGFTLFIITLAAAEAVVGLALVLAMYRRSKSVLMEKMNLLQG